jgi:hypothetical protein
MFYASLCFPSANDATYNTITFSTSDNRKSYEYLLPAEALEPKIPLSILEMHPHKREAMEPESPAPS